MKRLSQAAAAAALVIPSTALSATIDQTVTFGDTTAFSADVFNSFDLYDGPETLTGVEVLYSYSSNGVATAIFCAIFQDCTPSDASISLFGTGAFAGLNLSDSASTGINNSTNFTQTGNFALSLNGAFNPVALSDFTGTGSVAGAIEADGFYDSYAFVAGSHSGSVTLRYTTEDITPVPLPSSLGLLALGVVGFGALRRRG